MVVCAHICVYVCDIVRNGEGGRQTNTEVGWWGYWMREKARYTVTIEVSDLNRSWEGMNHPGFLLTTSQCERQASKLQCRCQNAILAGTTDSYGIIATKHLTLDSPPELRGYLATSLWGETGKKRKFSFLWRLQGFHNIASTCSKNLKKLELGQSEPKRRITRKQVAIRNVLTTEITKLLHDTSWSQRKPALCLVCFF